MVLTYVNMLPIAWRLAIFIDAAAEVVGASTREAGPGCDFYGRHTDAMWFHIPSAKRAVIALLLNSAAFNQVLNCVFCLYYWPYLATQTWPGAFLINIWALLSIVSVVSAGVIQGAEEAKLIAAQPEKFPPPMAQFVKEAFQKWKSGESGKPLLETIKQALDEAKHVAKAKGQGAGMLSEIAVVA